MVAYRASDHRLYLHLSDFNGRWCTLAGIESLTVFDHAPQHALVARPTGDAFRIQML